MTVAAYVHDPNAVEDFSIDWLDRLAEGDTIVASTWVIPTGIVKINDTSIATKTVVWLSTCTAGVEYLIVNHVTTAGGRQLDRSIIILGLET